MPGTIACWDGSGSPVAMRRMSENISMISRTISNPVPTELNPLGVKGAGEAGTVGAMPALMNAIMNALAEVGVKHLDMPATAERVWQAIQQAKAS